MNVLLCTGRCGHFMSHKVYMIVKYFNIPQVFSLASHSNTVVLPNLDIYL